MSSTLIVPVALIEKISPHPNADRLEIAQILGWQVVMPKGQHHVGQKIVYFPPDAVLPAEVSDRFGVTQYLSHGRVRCARLRGEPSFGFAVLPDNPDWEVGENVAEHYRAVKYEPPLRPSAGDAERAHPLFERYTDMENLRNFPDIFAPGEMVVVTEKVHGSNCRIGIVEGEWMAGSMAVRRKRPDDASLHSSTYWFPYTLPPVRALVEYVAQNPCPESLGFARDKLLRRNRQVILYGEVYGSSIQSFHYGMVNRIGFVAFDLLVDGTYMDWPDFAALCAQFGVAIVPALYEGPFSLEIVRQYSAGKTTFDDTHIREGVVVKPLRERTHPKIGRVVLKYLSDAYLFDDKKSDFTDQ